MTAALTSTINLRDVTFSNNSAWEGGAIRIDNSNGTQSTFVEGCAFVGNSAASQGGAISTYVEPLQIRNSTFYDNAAGTNGGAILATTWLDNPHISSSTFYQNTAGLTGGAIWLTTGAGGVTALVRNTVLWGNGTDMEGEQHATITHTCSQEFLSLGAGNVLAVGDPIDLGPMGELFLDPASICVDNGNDATATADYATLGLDWQLLTTQVSGVLDASPVDMGVHYQP